MTDDAESTSSKLLAQRLLIAVVAPVGLLLFVGLILAFQIVRLTDTAHWVDHTDEVMGRVGEVQNEILEQETALRGFLLSGDRVFLASYGRAQPLPLFTRLHDLVMDNPPQQIRIDSSRASYEAWLGLSDPIVQPGADLAKYRTPDSLNDRRRRMDAIHEALQAAVTEEQTLRVQRAAAYADSNRLTTVLGIPLFIALALGLAFISRRQLGEVSGTYRKILDGERATRLVVEGQNWVRSQLIKVAEAVQGDPSPENLGRRALEQLCSEIGAVAGVFYVAESGGFRRRASVGLTADTRDFFAEGEGLVARGARAAPLLHLREVPRGYLQIGSGTGRHEPIELVLLPAVIEGTPIAILEFAFWGKVEPRAFELLERASDIVASALRSAEQKVRLADLLEEAQRQSEELQAQQEELRVANEELQQQGDVLRSAHAQLEEGKEELEASNSNLALQRDALEKSQRTLAEKMAELEKTSRFKSEFLANMSHELRTPLNSSLILAKLLADNREQNLTEEQIKFASTIYSSGNDLLSLINDILDLSKIEAGKVEINIEPTTVVRLVDSVTRTFEPIAKQKGVGFSQNLPTEELSIETDTQRVQQILKNLLSNAFKFTERGEVTLLVSRAPEGIGFAVRDTGIGIKKSHQSSIFEAFRQADGTTNRRFGGTGLGLSISRDLAIMLGGTLEVESNEGQGSTFTLTLPLQFAPPSQRPSPLQAPRAAPSPKSAVPATPVPPAVQTEMPAFDDDRAHLDGQKRVLLIVEDDVTFAEVLAKLATELSFQFLLAHTADEGVRLAVRYLPTAIIMDVNLPDHFGISALDRLKQNSATRHIPIHMISADDHAQLALSMGAASYLVKPVKREEIIGALTRMKEQFSRMRRLLVVEDDTTQREAVIALLASQDVEIVGVSTVADAQRELSSSTFDCVVTDLSLPDGSGYDLLESMASDDAFSFPPVIVYTGSSLSPDEERRLNRFSSSIIVKGARSPERLLDEVTLFLHQVESRLPVDRQRMLRQVRDREAVFDGRKILVAEDDVRNIFALSSILEPKGAKLFVARNGREALEHLERTPDIDLVLMDIMMPEMDGLAATRAIRQRSERWNRVPIIALTAKAMRNDRELCLEAGANDYIAKPLDVEILLSLVRVWLPKS